MGFDRSGDYLLTISHSGSDVFSTRTWERIARDTRPAYPESIYGVGIGPIDGVRIPVTEMNYDIEELILISPDRSTSLVYDSGTITVVERKEMTEMVERELAAMGDPALSQLVRELRIDAQAVARTGDDGLPGRRHVCWTVLEHQPSKTGVAYCDAGFGPWVLVPLNEPRITSGIDTAWFASLEEAVREGIAGGGGRRTSKDRN